MKILEVIPALSSGGAERFVVDLCNQMAIDGHEVTLLTMKDFSLKNYGFYKDDLMSKIRVINLGLGKFNIQTFYEVYKAIKQIQCDVVHLHLIASTFFCLLPLLFDRKKKYVVTCHNQAESERESGKIKFFTKKICLKFRLFVQVAISHQNAKSIEDVYSVAPVKLIYNGRASVRTTNQYDKVKEEIEQYKQNKKTNVFTIIARCNPQKNIPKLIRCFNQLIDSGEDIILLVIGSGYDSPEILPMVKQANGKIHFLGQRHNVVDYLAYSDFFTLSSNHEGMPITLIEALACGCIPVGTPVSGFNDIIEDGKTGFIAKDFSDEAYLDALKRTIIHENGIVRDDLRKLYESKLSIVACAKEYEMLFEQMIQMRSSRPTQLLSYAVENED